jgi:hypothetical protein
MVLDRLVAEAIARFMPDQAAADAEAAAEARHVTFHHDQIGFNGTTYFEGELDLADAHDLETALAQTAEQLKTEGCAESLGVRRAIALGVIARQHLGHDLNTGSSGGPTLKPRQVVLYVHLAESAITRHGNDLELARVENQRQVLTADQVRTWCANPDTQVVVKPVIDLNAHIHVSAYEIPDRLRAQAELRDTTCVFPWCTRPAKKCDIDHVIAHRKGGTTCSCNTAPLCRRHHRLKTHSPWTYTALEPGTYLWSSPHGYQFLRDHTGTLDVTRDHDPP